MTESYLTFRDYLEKTGELNAYFSSPLNNLISTWIDVIYQARLLLSIDKPTRDIINHNDLKQLLEQLPRCADSTEQLENTLHEMLQYDEVYLRHVTSGPFLDEPVSVTYSEGITIVKSYSL